MKKLLLVLQIATVLFTIVCTQTMGQTINTLAGTSTAGYTGDGGPSTAAELSQSVGVATDDSGNVYICDSHNNVIRKVSAATGIITTVVGNGTNSNSVLMDGIPATASELSDPWAVVVDDSGNLYIADYGDKAIRKVTKATGLISTLAGTGTWSFSGDGGPATAAELSVVLGVAIDDSGNVYIADQWNHRVRKITKATGIIKTIAGTGTAAFSGDGGPGTAAELAYPSSLVVDDSGNVYIDDQWNNEVRILSQKTGIINRFAGNAAGATSLFSGGYSGDGGPATAAEINFPTGICLDDSGNVYIGDWANEVIRKVTIKTGIITTVAGDGYNAGSSGSGGYSGDGGPATAAELNAPSGVATDKCGDIYIADYYNNRVRKVTVSDSAVIAISPIAPSICSGGSTMLIGAGAISYTWSPATGLSATIGDTVTANPTTSTTYTVTGNNGCSTGTTQVVVTVTPGLSPTVQPQIPSVCSGQQLTLTASGGTNYTWSTGATDSTITVTTTKDTTYYVTVSNGSCSGIDTVNVLVIPAPPLIIQPPSPVSVCLGQGVILSVPTSGSGYTWSPASTLNSSTGDTVTATPSSQTTYLVTGVDSLGCTVTSDSEVVTINTGPSKPTITQHDSVLISSSTQSNQWLRNDTIIQGATNQDYTVIISGYYQVTVSNPANGCSTTSDSLFASGINQLIVNSGQLSVYPNPASGEVVVNISSSVGEVKNWHLQIIDVLGRVVYTKSSLNYTNVIDISNLSCGVYFISVINRTGRAVVPLVKQN